MVSEDSVIFSLSKILLVEPEGGGSNPVEVIGFFQFT
jgi:hypothetical protein